jgi:arylsulfatase
MWEGPELAPADTIASTSNPTVLVSVRAAAHCRWTVEAARNTLDHTTPVTFPEDESFDVD